MTSEIDMMWFTREDIMTLMDFMDLQKHLKAIQIESSTFLNDGQLAY